MTGIVKVDEIQNNAGTTTLAKLDGNQLTGVLSPTGMRNRIINGDMRIDQRNAGAAVTFLSSVSNIYTLDRWTGFKQISTGGSFTIAQSTTAPAGYTHSTLITITSSAASSGTDVNAFAQFIEGFNVADLGWGTANAQPITLSFWVRSSITGTYSVVINNNGYDYSYIANYTINSANTFEQKTITIPGPTSGTWVTNNGVGLRLWFDLGTGAGRNGTAGSWVSSQVYRTSGSIQLLANNGATFYITGVQLEKGTVATPFEFRSIGQELALCQRYYQQLKSQPAIAYTTGAIISVLNMFVEMRSAPTLSKTSGNFRFGDAIAFGGTSGSTPTIYGTDAQGREKLLTYQLSGFSGFTVRHVYFQETEASNPALFTLSSEL